MVCLAKSPIVFDGALRWAAGRQKEIGSRDAARLARWRGVVFRRGQDFYRFFMFGFGVGFSGVSDSCKRAGERFLPVDDGGALTTPAVVRTLLLPSGADSVSVWVF